MTVYGFVLMASILLLSIAANNDLFWTDMFEAGQIVHTKSTKRVYIVFALMLIVVAGCRYYVGTDFGAYYQGAFTSSYENLIERLKLLDEPGIHLINTFLSKFTTDGAVSIFVLAFITVSLCLRSTYINSYSVFYSGLFYLLFCWTDCFNGIRQALAAAVIFSGYKYIQEKKLFKFLLIVVIGFLIHRSAIVMAFLYLMSLRKVSIKNILILIVGSVAVLKSYDRFFSVIETVMNKTYDLATNEYIAREINPLRIAVAVVPAIVFLFLYWNVERTQEDEFSLNLLIFHAVVMVLASKSAMLGRISIYTSPFLAVGLSNLTIKLPDRTRSLMGLLMIILYIAFWWYQIGHSGDMSQFTWVFQR